jgi:anthranilate synthase component II
MQKILIIDNYDSFTYNLVHMVPNSVVIRNNELTLEQIKAQKFDKIIISPGPGSPDDPKYFGVCSEVILQLGKTIPILGICLGMQGISHFFGGEVKSAKNKMHGKISTINHTQNSIFANIPNNINIMRYHSLVVSNLPDCLEILATSADDREIMAIRHTKYPIFGVQYHPESFASQYGEELINNFLNL